MIESRPICVCVHSRDHPIITRNVLCSFSLLLSVSLPYYQYSLHQTMLSTVSSAFLLIASITLIFSTHVSQANELPGNYTVSEGSDHLCFIAQFDLTLNVEYTMSDEKKNVSKIPLNNVTYQSYHGSCSSNNSHTLTIVMLDKQTTITFDFTLNEKNQTSLTGVYGAVHIDVNEYFPNCGNTSRGLHAFAANESLFSTGSGNSYRCNTQTRIDNFKSEGVAHVKSIDLENLRVQPFVDSNTTFHDFAVEKVCPTDVFRSSNLIPIIVGVCLGVLVIAVLVAYLIGRGRNRNGYQSV